MGSELAHIRAPDERTCANRLGDDLSPHGSQVGRAEERREHGTVCMDVRNPNVTVPDECAGRELPRRDEHRPRVVRGAQHARGQHHAEGACEQHDDVTGRQARRERPASSAMQRRLRDSQSPAPTTLRLWPARQDGTIRRMSPQAECSARPRPKMWGST
jgi:hypothetical protein